MSTHKLLLRNYVLLASCGNKFRVTIQLFNRNSTKLAAINVIANTVELFCFKTVQKISCKAAESNDLNRLIMNETNQQLETTRELMLLCNFLRTK